MKICQRRKLTRAFETHQGFDGTTDMKLIFRQLIWIFLCYDPNPPHRPHPCQKSEASNKCQPKKNR